MCVFPTRMSKRQVSSLLLLPLALYWLLDIDFASESFPLMGLKVHLLTYQDSYIDGISFSH